MKRVFIALTAVIVMASCKKESVTSVINTTPTGTKKLAKTIDVYDNGIPEANTYTYDAQGRIAVIKEESRTYTFNFVSATTLLATEKKNLDNSLSQTYECTLNDKGYITKMLFKNPSGAVIYSYDYTYNADGNITSQKGTSPSGSNYETVYVLANGNLVSSKLYYDNVLSQNREHTYDINKINKAGIGYSFYWNVPNLFGKGSKNMLVEYKSFNTSNTLVWHAQFTYNMDADGYIVKQNTNYVMQGKQGVITYTFE